MKKLLAAFLLLLPLLPETATAQESAVFTLQADHTTPFRFVVQLDSAAAPDTVANFEKLIRHHFYNGIKVHRAISHTLVQMGDPLSRHGDRSRIGTGGPGYTLAPEIHLRHVAGAVAMARLPDSLNPGRRSSGSQFYICLKPMPNLDGQYTVFGRVTEGLDILDSLSTVETDTNDFPVTPVVIRSARVFSGPVPPPPPPKHGFHIPFFH